MTATKRRIFRWKAVGPLLLVFVVLVVLWMIFGDRLVQRTGSEVATDLLGTEVDLSGLRIRETDAAVDLGRIQVADPFNPARNLVETGAVTLDVEPAALLEKKLVIDRLSVRDVTFGTTRATPARTVQGGGYAPTLLRELAQWKQQFDVPVLKLTPIDTLKQLVLDPGTLGTVHAAEGLIATADSTQQTFRRQVDSLKPQPLIDSARALATRLAGASPTRLGVNGTKDAVQSIRRTLHDIDGMKQRIAAVRQSGEAGLGDLRSGVAALDVARQKDYAFARSLLQLPRFDAPNIGTALFGPVSIDQFQQAAYWAQLVQRYLPPGLRPREEPGPRRLRMAGTSVVFPRENSYPTFLLRQGDLSLSLQSGGARHSFDATVAGITSDPALYGRPATLAANGAVGGDHPLRLSVGAVLDHSGAEARDSLAASVVGVPIPVIRIPGLPFQVDPGAASVGLDFMRVGEEIKASWTLHSTAAAWRQDSTAAGSDPVRNLVWQVVSGLHDLQVTAEISGRWTSPHLSVHSNLDEALATRLKSLLGEEVARAEARARAEVDRLVAPQVQAANARVDAFRGEIDTRVGQVQTDLDKAKSDLTARLRSLSGGLGGLLGS